MRLKSIDGGGWGIQGSALFWGGGEEKRFLELASVNGA